jgi:glycosyltransferase involved in cell wall biosynthesis
VGLEPLRLGLALPFFNEAPLIPEVIHELDRALRPLGSSVAVALVDNGSTDGTMEALQTACAPTRAPTAPSPLGPHYLPLRLPKNRGYGGGILAGIDLLRARYAPAVLGWAWGDGQVDPQVIPPLLHLVESGFPVAKTRRIRREDGWQRRWVSAGYAHSLGALGVHLPDVNGCPKLLRTSAYDALNPASEDWFLDPEVILGAIARGWPVASLPVTMRRRKAGRSKVNSAAVAQFIDHLVRWQLGWRPQRKNQ